MDWRARGIGLRIGGHRGSSALAPENTYAAFEQALADGVMYVETDVRRTADGELILLHDETLERTTDGLGPISERTLADVRGLDAGSWFGEGFRGQRVPEFIDFLRWIEKRPGLGAALEIKSAATGAEVAELAWACPARDRLAISSFLEAEIGAAKAAVPEMPCLLLSRLDDDPSTLIARMAGCGADGADVPQEWAARALIAAMRERDMLVGGGTAGGAEAAGLVALGVDFVDSDRPADLIAALGSLAGSL